MTSASRVEQIATARDRRGASRFTLVSCSRGRPQWFFRASDETVAKQLRGTRQRRYCFADGSGVSSCPERQPLAAVRWRLSKIVRAARRLSSGLPSSFQVAATMQDRLTHTKSSICRVAVAS
jgi:hypothetical protein